MIYLDVVRGMDYKVGGDMCIFFVRMRRFLGNLDILYVVYSNFCTNTKTKRKSFTLAAFEE